nr:MAG TPA: hypothetical protein [Caudoviricetes sp.]
MVHTVSYYLGNRNDFIPLTSLHKAVCTPKQLYFLSFLISTPFATFAKL